MDRYHPIRRAPSLLAGLAGALLALAAASPAALAIRLPPPGGYDRPAQPPPPVHPIASGGMPGWQITLIAVAAAVIAAAVAVIADRAWAARRHLPARTA